MNPKGSVTERLLQLEGDLQAVKQELRAANHRAARIGAPNNFRIARITNTPNANDDTFEVVFLDGKYTQSAGYNAPSYADRQLSARAVVHNIAGVKLAKDDVIPVWSWSNRFWTYVTEASTPPSGSQDWMMAIYNSPEYWLDTSTEDTTHPTWFTSDLTYSRSLKYVCQWANVAGDHAAMGITTPDYRFYFDEGGFHEFNFSCNVQICRLNTSWGTTDYGLLFRVYLSPGGGFTSPFQQNDLISHRVMHPSDWDDSNKSTATGPAGSYDVQLHILTLNGWTTADITADTYHSLRIGVEDTIGNLTDYAIRVSDPLLTIKRLEPL